MHEQHQQGKVEHEEGVEVVASVHHKQEWQAETAAGTSSSAAMVTKTLLTDADTVSLFGMSNQMERPRYTESEDEGYRSSAEQTQTQNRSNSNIATNTNDGSSDNNSSIAFIQRLDEEKARSRERGGDGSVDSKSRYDKRHGDGDTSASTDENEVVDKGIKVVHHDDDDDDDDVYENGGDVNLAPTLSPNFHWDGVAKEDEEEGDLSSRQDELGGMGPSADCHPLPRCSSASFSTMTKFCQPAKERGSSGSSRSANRSFNDAVLNSGAAGDGGGGGGGGSGTSLRRSRTMNGHQTTVSSLLGAGGSGATTVSIEGDTCRANTSYPSIGGHHMAIQHDGVFMKESCSCREERFYEMVKPVQEYLHQHPEVLAALYPSITTTTTTHEDDDAEEEEEEEETKEYASCDNEEGYDKCNRNTSNSLLPPHVELRRWRWRWGMPAGNDETGVVGRSSDGHSATITGDDDAVGENALRGVRHWSTLLKLVPFIPRYIGVYSVRVGPGVQGRHSAAAVGAAASGRVDGGESGGDVRQMILLEDLCNGFTHPCILDIKMGCRQYGLNPSEKKLHSKERKAAMSTSMQYGVRLAGMKLWCPDTQQYETQSKVAGRYLTLEGLHDTTVRFMQRSKRLRHGFRNQLCILRHVFLEQHVFCFFTSSLLFVYDADRPLFSMRVVMVDFAFTYEREELRRGGDPDAEQECDFGYIKALDTMISILA